MGYLRQHIKEVVLAALILSCTLVWLLVWSRQESEVLKVYFFDVGQGDAIFIDSPHHGRMLIDGGPDRSVLSKLGSILPFGDRRIDVVMESHPDKDHIGGLPEVVRLYDVGAYIEPNVESENSIDDVLEERIRGKNIPSFFAKRGMVINFGDGAKLIVLFPNQNVDRWGTNDASVVAKLVYGEKSFLFTGDSPVRVEGILIKANQLVLDADVLKAGHHGSRTSTSEAYLDAVTPEYAVISVGKDNKYGHPHQEVIKMLEEARVKTKSTAISGTLVFETDGETLKVK